MRRDRQLFLGDHHIDQHRAVGAKRGLQRVVDLRGFFDANAFYAAGFSNAGEIGVVQLGTVGQIAPAFISIATNPSTLLLKITIFTGSFICASERKSPISMLKPPSPHIATT